MAVRIEKILCTVVHKVLRQQVEETMNTLSKRPEGFLQSQEVALLTRLREPRELESITFHAGHVASSTNALTVTACTSTRTRGKLRLCREPFRPYRQSLTAPAFTVINEK